ncbi:hypothetical protein NKR19_g3991 [Coniochaeta hoffmannii]|uniref:Uncharacterized protein n=1 Tax=Coniochaeta hoffmannii TaxID=91930 RepID=A0AA38VKQ6_9PEZI|nr:hypothetical protein NKR19_g3991 [Coniochaeta hoffmannii]
MANYENRNMLRDGNNSNRDSDTSSHSARGPDQSMTPGGDHPAASDAGQIDTQATDEEQAVGDVPTHDSNPLALSRSPSGSVRLQHGQPAGRGTPSGKRIVSDYNNTPRRGTPSGKRAVSGRINTPSIATSALGPATSSTPTNHHLTPHHKRVAFAQAGATGSARPPPSTPTTTSPAQGGAALTPAQLDKLYRQRTRENEETRRKLEQAEKRIAELEDETAKGDGPHEAVYWQGQDVEEEPAEEKHAEEYPDGEQPEEDHDSIQEQVEEEQPVEDKTEQPEREPAKKPLLKGWELKIQEWQHNSEESPVNEESSSPDVRKESQPNHGLDDDYQVLQVKNETLWDENARINWQNTVLIEQVRMAEENRKDEIDGLRYHNSQLIVERDEETRRRKERDVELKALRRELWDLEQRNAELVAQNEDLRRENDELTVQNDELLGENDELATYAHAKEDTEIAAAGPTSQGWDDYHDFTAPQLEVREPKHQREGPEKENFSPAPAVQSAGTKSHEAQKALTAQDVVGKKGKGKSTWTATS